MAATQPPTIPSAPTTVPQRNNRDAFSNAFEAFLVWFLGNFSILVAAISSAYTNALEAFNSATDAANSASAATNAAALAMVAANASAWVSGATYALNACVISQVNFQTYRKITASSSSTTDPYYDSTNWRILNGNGANGVFTPLPSTVQIDLAKSNYFVVTLSAPSTLSIINCPPGGCAFVVELVVTGGSLTLPSNVRTPSDAALGLTTGKTHMLVFSTSNGGGRFKLSSSLNFNMA